MNGNAQAGSANVQKVVDDLIEMANRASMPIGLPTWSTGEFNRYAEQGAQLLTIGSDLSFLAVQAESELTGVRRLLNGEHPQTGDVKAGPLYRMVQSDSENTYGFLD